MSDNLSDVYKVLNGQKIFRDVVFHAKAQRPELPDFDPKNDNTDDWKMKTGMRQGFDLAFVLLTGYDPTDYIEDKK